MDLVAIASAVVAHFAVVRRDLPWRRTRDPYAIWVSEIMLQQTRVATVIPYWERWMQQFPTVTALARAPLDDVLAAWAGLGYYSRARNLWSGAQVIEARWAGELPRHAAELREVRGIGRYTAGAIASIAFGERAPLVDGNVARVLARVFAVEHDIKSTVGQRTLWWRAGELMVALPHGVAPGDLNQGLMELGATICAPRPHCAGCPLSGHCLAARDDRTAELPIVAPRKRAAELPIIRTRALWIEAGGELVLVRRRPEGLFGGLWELPPFEIAKALGVTRIARSPVAFHDQTLTHRRLRIAVVQATAPHLVALRDPSYDAITRVTIAAARRLGIAAATAAILTKYEDTPWSSTPTSSTSSPKATRRSSKASAGSATTSTTKTSRTRRAARPKASTSSSTTSGR